MTIELIEHNALKIFLVVQKLRSAQRKEEQVATDLQSKVHILQKKIIILIMKSQRGRL